MFRPILSLGAYDRHFTHTYIRKHIPSLAGVCVCVSAQPHLHQDPRRDWMDEQ